MAKTPRGVLAVLLEGFLALVLALLALVIHGECGLPLGRSTAQGFSAHILVDMLELVAVLFSILVFFQVVAFLFYPNNGKESKVVVQRALNRSENETHMFLASDENFVNLFQKILRFEKENLKNIENVKNSKNILLLFLKYLVFNRARPDVPTDLIIPSNTTHTPALPSGHSFQAFLIAKHYAKKYPHLAPQLFDLAEAIGQSRIAAGWHYPSDHELSKNIVLNYI